MKALKVKITNVTDKSCWYKNRIGEEFLVSLPGRHTLNHGYDLLGTEVMDSEWKIPFYDCVVLSEEVV
ncbi:MAG: hypothetical protein PHG08_00810 [Bacilli bacterium]|nr:hypothetical protein [Bacilli bacterium]